MEDMGDEERALAELLLGDPDILAWLGGHRPKPDDADDDSLDGER